MIIWVLRKIFGDEKLHNFFWGLTTKHPSRVRDIKVDGEKYLRRFYLTPRRLDTFGELNVEIPFGIKLHYFYMGDEDRQLHNHPWKWAISYILLGGYLEERRNNKTMEVVTRNVAPGTFNFISGKTFHRVIKKPEAQHVWTLLITGPRVKDWGFWNRETMDFTPYKDYVTSEGQGYKPLLNE